MKKLVAIVAAMVLALSAFAMAETVAFNDPAAVRPESIEYPVQGLSWNATTDVKANGEYTIAMIVKNNTNPFMNQCHRQFLTKYMFFPKPLIISLVCITNRKMCRTNDNVIILQSDVFISDLEFTRSHQLVYCIKHSLLILLLRLNQCFCHTQIIRISYLNV